MQNGSEMERRLNILYQFNEKYAPYAGVSIFSILCNNRKIKEIHFYILGEDLIDASKIKIEKMIEDAGREVDFIDTNQLIRKMKALDMPTYRGSYAANMRLFLDEVLAENVERVLYLDADTIVDSTLGELLNADLQGKAIGMVLDSLGESHKRQIGLAGDDDYYNSGVILFDMKRWKEEQYSKRIAEHVAKRRSHYPAPDQDLLNVVCKGDILRLGAEYNFQPAHAAFLDKQYYSIMRPRKYYSRNELVRARKRIVIYHCFRFLGEFPWNRGNLHPHNEIFDEYLRKSPWADYEKKAADNSIIIKIEKVLYKILPGALFLPIFRIAHTAFLHRANKESLQNKTDKLM